jgi:hypothetical protein
MNNALRNEAAAQDAEAAELTRRIDELMAGPVKARPAVTVLGDDAVAGFTPAEAETAGKSRFPARLPPKDAPRSRP